MDKTGTSKRCTKPEILVHRKYQTSLIISIVALEYNYLPDFHVSNERR